ncbi:MAG: 6-phosphofructokinase [Clostridia bacterium]|nr:6-phosphofructokinase [Clostridia bacterium]
MHLEEGGSVLVRLGLLSAGGDCPGINAVIRAVVKTAVAAGVPVVGFVDGFRGLVEGRARALDAPAISGLLHRGGTVLGTSNREDPFRFPVRRDGEVRWEDRSREAIETCRRLGVAGLLVIGGDGSLAVARELSERGLPVIGVPKSIDNDLPGTEQTFGFDTAVATACEALDRLHTTAESHHRIMVLEVMGRYSGWIALASGIAGGADVVLIPEIPWREEAVVAKIRQRCHEGKPFSVVVGAEGVRGPAGEVAVERTVAGSVEPVRLGGVAHAIGRRLEELTGMETRVTVLGHIQRGGSPSPSDRLLATQLGVRAAELAVAGRFGVLVAVREGRITEVPLAEVPRGYRAVPRDHDWVRTARAVGICLGDA